MMAVDTRKTGQIRSRYDRLARLADLMQRGEEKAPRPWVVALWKAAIGPRILEVGVGSGHSMSCYPPDAEIVAIDLSPRMLDRAKRRATKKGIQVTLREADVQALPFPDGIFDTVISSCVFCSVPDPVQGFREIRRVLKPGGQLLMLEHVLSRHFLMKPLMIAANPLVVRIMGANINRDTVSNVRSAGFSDLHSEDLWLDVMKRIEARAPGSTA